MNRNKRWSAAASAFYCGVAGGAGQLVFLYKLLPITPADIPHIIGHVLLGVTVGVAVGGAIAWVHNLILP